MSYLVAQERAESGRSRKWKHRGIPPGIHCARELRVIKLRRKALRQFGE